MTHLTAEQLEAGFDHIRQSPSDDGRVEQIVRRPAVGEREVLQSAELDSAAGLVGDRWGGKRGNPECQINIMNARVIALVAGEKDRWALAGDQLFVDLDLSEENLPVGSRLAIGNAVVEVTAPPHTGCSKFAARFGMDARDFVNARKHLRLRGINARVVEAGTIRVGDVVTVSSRRTPSPAAQ
ncbi:MAG TPA: MOSC domain-containing protein [Vicinamibacterales bacterium]|nr:MOSC domain-containing protein [Vicinamibacterales bacterium]